MHKPSSLLAALIILPAMLLAGAHASAQNPFSNLFGTPVAFQYTCGTASGSLPTCTTNFFLPPNKRLILQNVSGSATPINPNAAGNFATNQASLTLTTQLGNEAPIANIVGPNYAIANTATWFYNTLVTIYTDTVPVVANNGGSVYIQAYMVNKQ